MVISTSTTRTFIPEWMGNKDLSGVEQIKITHKAPTIALKEKLFVRQFDFAQDGQKEGMVASMSVIVNRKQVLSSFVTAIENVVVSVDGVEKKVATVDQLFEAGVELDGLVEEIYTYLNNLVNQKGVDEKN